MATPNKKPEIKKKVPPITIQGANIIYKNFAGAARQFNAAGLRNFHVVLDVELAKKLERDGWNVRWHDPKEEGDPAWPSLKVAVRFDNYPPRVLMITTKGRTTLDANTIEILDFAEFDTVDLVISPSSWEVSGKHGIKAYLQKMFVTLSENDLEAKYATPSSPARVRLEEDED